MNVIPTRIEGVVTLETEVQRDDRGLFARTYDSTFLSEVGISCHFPQHSIAVNELAGTLRGLHYQIAPRAEHKIVRCTRGALFDVAVDLRVESSTFGEWVAVELSEANLRALYIPAGCAHGYQTLADDTHAYYMISEPYEPDLARGIYYADASLAIRWPLPVSRISERDRGLPGFDRLAR